MIEIQSLSGPELECQQTVPNKTHFHFESGWETLIVRCQEDQLWYLHRNWRFRTRTSRRQGRGCGYRYSRINTRPNIAHLLEIRIWKMLLSVCCPLIRVSEVVNDGRLVNLLPESNSQFILGRRGRVASVHVQTGACITLTAVCRCRTQIAYYRYFHKFIFLS